MKFSFAVLLDCKVRQYRRQQLKPSQTDRDREKMGLHWVLLAVECREIGKRVRTVLICACASWRNWSVAVLRMPTHLPSMCSPLRINLLAITAVIRLYRVRVCLLLNYARERERERSCRALVEWVMVALLPPPPPFPFSPFSCRPSALIRLVQGHRGEVAVGGS